eukprot:GILI01003278.1.p1 GENE.GILI01003278.1~~GILI01003278.1.p1  ORF type:complete len:205 (+),score=34.82 GILI01003278.1:232-846(+)
MRVKQYLSAKILTGIQLMTNGGAKRPTKLAPSRSAKRENLFSVSSDPNSLPLKTPFVLHACGELYDWKLSSGSSANISVHGSTLHVTTTSPSSSPRLSAVDTSLPTLMVHFAVSEEIPAVMDEMRALIMKGVDTVWVFDIQARLFWILEGQANDMNERIVEQTKALPCEGHRLSNSSIPDFVLDIDGMFSAVRENSRSASPTPM